MTAEEVVKPFEEALNSLKAFLGPLGAIGSFVHYSSHRLESLYYRCRLVALEENARMFHEATGRMDGDSRSQHIRILAQGLATVTIPTIASQVAGIDELIVNCEAKALKRLEVESRLIRLATNIILQDVGETNAHYDSSVDIAAVKRLCSTYPETAGLLSASCDKVQQFLHGKSQAAGHPLYTKATSRTWWGFPKHVVGDLRKCPNGKQSSTLDAPTISKVFTHSSSRLC